MTDHGKGLVGVAHMGCYIASKRRDQTRRRDQIGGSVTADLAKIWLVRDLAAAAART